MNGTTTAGNGNGIANRGKLLRPRYPSSSSSSLVRRGTKNGHQQGGLSATTILPCSLSMVILYGIVGSMFLYILAVVSMTSSLSMTQTSSMGPSQHQQPLQTTLRQKPLLSREKSNSNEWKTETSHDYEKHHNLPPKDITDTSKRKTGGMAGTSNIQPQLIVGRNNKQHQDDMDSEEQQHSDHDLDAADLAHNPIPHDHYHVDSSRLKRVAKTPTRVLTAYLEPIDRETWKNKPLTIRTSTAQDLKVQEFPQLNSCRHLTEQWPVDNYPNDDPFLPWIHDVFPTHDGRFIQFVAQNKRRCRTGTTLEDIAARAHTEPQVSLFQHVAVRRLQNTTTTTQPPSPRYRLSSHEEADLDGMETRFICKFQPSGEETLSVYNFNYEWASFRKHQSYMFHEDGRDNKQIHTSQLTFKCPVPLSLVETIRTGASVQNDYATLFVDLIPIRTPPRYGSPTEFLPPYYAEFAATGTDKFDADIEWGSNHLLPLIQDSGRWANIPICKPSLLTYGKQVKEADALALKPSIVSDKTTKVEPIKQHHLASCLWASTGYATRGNRFAINDGQRRLLEWITYNKLIGVDHFYLYDNSGAFRNNNNDTRDGGEQENSLRAIAELFPNDVTVIDWPCKVCNNNPNNVDSVGERSSQYAAEASCRLRFGPHVQWIAQFDIDEYLVPMGNHTSILPVLEKLDQEGKKIISFGSWRAWPRRRFIETPQVHHGRKVCGRDQDCFELRIPLNYTMLQSYNCDRQKPGEKQQQMPAEKQIYRPDYVLHHFIHYSTVTALSNMNRQDVLAANQPWMSRNAFPDPLSRFGDEINEALMLHTKAVATQDTVFWELACRVGGDSKSLCRLGTPYPDDMTGVNETAGDEGWKFNCYVNHKIDEYWVPRLEEQLRRHIPELAQRLDQQQQLRQEKQ